MRKALSSVLVVLPCLMVLAPGSALAQAPAPSVVQATPAPMPPTAPYTVAPTVVVPVTTQPQSPSLPDEIDDDGQPTPAGYHMASHARKGLVIAGAVVFGAFYIPSLSIGLFTTNSNDHWLAVPLLGPILDSFSLQNCNTNSLNSASCALARTGLGFDFAGQLLGAALFTSGFLFPATSFRRDIPRGASLEPTFTWSVAPISFGRQGSGLGLVGTF